MLYFRLQKAALLLVGRKPQLRSTGQLLPQSCSQCLSLVTSASGLLLLTENLAGSNGHHLPSRSGALQTSWHLTAACSLVGWERAFFKASPGLVLPKPNKKSFSGRKTDTYHSL